MGLNRENEVASGLRRAIMKVGCYMCVSETQHTSVLKISRVLALAACCCIECSVRTLQETKSIESLD